MIYKVMYRGENSKRLQQLYKIGKYIIIETEIQSHDKKDCLEYARKMNKHLKKFHNERFGKNVYFVRGQNEK